MPTHTYLYLYLYVYICIYTYTYLYDYIYDFFREVSGVILFLVSYHIISFFFYVWELEEHDIRSIIDVCIM